MVRRCQCAPGHPDYPHYAGRGITVCAAWQDFDAFAAHMGPYPGKGWSLDRIDNNDGYRPGNVRWATAKVQNRNRSNTLRDCDIADIRALYHGDCRRKRGGLSQQALADMYGVGKTTIWHIVCGATWR